MEAKERIALANKFFEDSQNLVGNLYGRWQDEKEYEDINDYGKPVQKALEKIGGKLVSMHKKPFGFTYELGGYQYRVKYTAKEYSFGRVDQMKAAAKAQQAPAPRPATEGMHPSLAAYFDMAREGRLPSDFKDWDLKGINGWTVAHEAARFGKLPANFDKWDMADETGTTVRMVAVECGHAPEFLKKPKLG